MFEHQRQHLLDWNKVETALAGLHPVEGGYSQAKRGIVTVSDKMDVFVKLGQEGETPKWCKKEIGIYRFLENQRYPFIPKLLAVNADETAFALTACTPEQGWDWTSQWTDRRVAKTLEALDNLASLKLSKMEKAIFEERTVKEDNDGWGELLRSLDLQQKLLKKLNAAGEGGIARELDFEAETRKSEKFNFHSNSLVHIDVRADNCAWHERTGEVRLVDWNWAHLGDRRIDLAITLTHIHASGFDVLSGYSDRLDAQALRWMAGYWLEAAANPIWEGGPEHLRDMQLRSGLTALRLAMELG